VVSSYAIDDGARLLLFDPIAPPSEIDDLAAIDFGHGLEISPAEWLPEVEWLPPGVTREQIAEALRPLLALPVEHVLATHGGPTDRAALERALSFS
jgi:hypothetical protein